MQGRRTILLLSPGFLTLTRNQQQGIMYLIERALRADVAVSSVDIRGLHGLNLSANQSHVNEAATAGVLDSQEGDQVGGVLQDLAYGTGGIYFHNNNDLDEGLRRAVDTPEYVYVLGFSPPKLDGKFHKLKVSVRGSTKLIVQARAGYYALRPPSNAPISSTKHESPGGPAVF